MIVDDTLEVGINSLISDVTGMSLHAITQFMADARGFFCGLLLISTANNPLS